MENASPKQILVIRLVSPLEKAKKFETAHPWIGEAAKFARAYNLHTTEGGKGLYHHTLHSKMPKTTMLRMMAFLMPTHESRIVRRKKDGSKKAHSYSLIAIDKKTGDTHHIDAPSKYMSRGQFDKIRDSIKKSLNFPVMILIKAMSNEEINNARMNRAMRRDVYNPNMQLPSSAQTEPNSPEGLKKVSIALKQPNRATIPAHPWTPEHIASMVNVGRKGANWYNDWREHLHNTPMETNQPGTDKSHDSEFLRTMFPVFGQTTNPQTNFARTAQAMSRHAYGLYSSQTDAEDLHKLGLLPHLSGGGVNISIGNVMDALNGRQVQEPKIADYGSGFLFPHERRAKGIPANAPIDDVLWRARTGMRGAPTPETLGQVTGEFNTGINRSEDPYSDEPTNAQGAYWAGKKRYDALQSKLAWRDYVKEFAQRDDQGKILRNKLGDPVFPEDRAKEASKIKSDIGTAIRNTGDLGTAQDVYSHFNMGDPENGINPLPVFAAHHILGKHLGPLRHLAEHEPFSVHEHVHYPIEKGKEHIQDILNHPYNEHFIEDTPEEYRPRFTKMGKNGYEEASPEEATHLYGDKDTIGKLLRGGFYGPKNEPAPKSVIQPSKGRLEVPEDTQIHLGPGARYDKTARINPKREKMVHRILDENPEMRNDLAHLGRILERSKDDTKKGTKDPWKAYAADAGPVLKELAALALEKARDKNEPVKDSFYKEGTFHDRQYRQSGE